MSSVEASCLAAFGRPNGNSSASVYERLHARMAQLRIAQDAGMHVDESGDDVAIRHRREQRRIRAILQMNMAGAMGMATPGEILFRVELGVCTRWGENVLTSFSTRGFEYLRLKNMWGVGIDSRPAVPGPLQLTSALQRVGPHGSPEALIHTELAICSYSQMVEEARAEAANAKAATIEVGIARGLALDDDDDYDDNDESTATTDAPSKMDWDAEAESGKRVWPPVVLSSSTIAKEACEITEQIQKTVEGLNVNDRVLACVPAIYPSTSEFVLASQSLAPQYRDAYAALGLGARSGKRNEIRNAGLRANLLAALAFATGHSELGVAFSDLASGTLSRCSQSNFK